MKITKMNNPKKITDLSGDLGRYCYFFLRYKRGTTYPSLGNKGECAPTSPLSEGATSSGTLTKTHGY